jgi:hypothetical protein
MEFRVENAVFGLFDFARFEIVLEILDRFVDALSFPRESIGGILGERFFASGSQRRNQEDRGQSACQKSGYAGAVLG